MKKIIRNTLIATAAAGVTAYGVCTLIDEILFNRKLTPPEAVSQKISGCDTTHLGEFLENNLQWVEDYGYERHYIYSDRGEKLTGYLLKAKEESDVYLFGAHGYRSHGRREFSKFVQYYLGKNINVFLPDHIASGESEGNFCSFGFYEKEDCMKWLGYMTETFGKDINIILHGVSMGCATVCMMTGKEDLPENVKFTVADCGFNKADDFFRAKIALMGIKGGDIITKGVCLANSINHGFRLEDISPVDSVKNAKIPMLFVHGTDDGLVPSYMCPELYESCGSEYKDILLVEGADHAQAFMIGREAYEEKLNEYIGKFI